MPHPSYQRRFQIGQQDTVHTPLPQRCTALRHTGRSTTSRRRCSSHQQGKPNKRFHQRRCMYLDSQLAGHERNFWR